MKGRLIKSAILLLMISTLLSGCSFAFSKRPRPQMGRMDFRIIELGSYEFNEINKGEFKSWYRDKSRVQGANTFSKGRDRFVLIGAGKKPTAGYSIEDIVVTGKEKEIEISARLYAPGKDEYAAQVITYPHVLIKIAEDGRKIILDMQDVVNDDAQEFKTDTGRYAGTQGSDLIKIRVTGVPDEIPPKVFKLSEDIINEISKLELGMNEIIIFDYIMDKDGNHVITRLQRK